MILNCKDSRLLSGKNLVGKSSDFEVYSIMMICHCFYAFGWE